ncbi:MAG TPA: tetratricopeptide repeat protein [Tepidisphaeraceae bacterium]|nr:tetratricopeptide repeat protein [Tepidisphaeraceae bacterium]
MVVVILLLYWLQGPTQDDRGRTRDLALPASLATLVVLQCVSIIPHELGHAVGGWLVGMQIGRITLGRGRRMVCWRVRGVAVELRAIPNVGSVAGTTDKMLAWRWRMFAFIAMAPITNFVIMLVAAKVSEFWTPTANMELTDTVNPWAILAAANLLVFLNSLFGRGALLNEGFNPSDGRRLFRLLFKPLPSVAARRIGCFSARAAWLIEAEKHDEALAILRQALAEFPSSVGLRTLFAVAQLGARDYAAGRENLLALLAENPTPNARRAILNNNLAWADLIMGVPERIEEADVASAEAYALLPWVASIQSTRGLLLVERGQFNVGIKLLKRSSEGVDTPTAKAAILCSLAIAQLRQNRPAAAQALLCKVMRLDPDCELLTRAQDVAKSAQVGQS